MTCALWFLLISRLLTFIICIRRVARPPRSPSPRRPVERCGQRRHPIWMDDHDEPRPCGSSEVDDKTRYCHGRWFLKSSTPLRIEAHDSNVPNPKTGGGLAMAVPLATSYSVAWNAQFVAWKGGGVALERLLRRKHSPNSPQRDCCGQHSPNSLSPPPSPPACWSASSCSTPSMVATTTTTPCAAAARSLLDGYPVCWPGIVLP